MRFTPEDDFVIPIRAVSCPYCADWVTVDELTMVETLWMHEYECSAIAKDYELAA
ncbi:MAG: hypothetical protein JWN44_5657 [Myxococcales bacterium]|nr:hypothetical protein [Myxococcales bacterium]